MRKRTRPLGPQVAHRLPLRMAALLVGLLLAAPPLRAGFAGTDVFIAAAARASGQFGAEFYTTAWVSNTTSAPVTLQIQLYLRDASNTSPATFVDTLAAGETKRYENVLDTLFHTTGSGALRFKANGDISVSSRTYSLPASGKLEDSVGLFFSGVPASFAIGKGETSRLQGVSQGGAEAFRYNAGFVETEGKPAVVHVSLKNGQGTEIATRDYSLLAAQQIQFSVADLTPAPGFPSVATTNGVLEASVTSGDGKVLAFGTQIANGSNDSAGFEMSFSKSLIAPLASGLSGVVAGTGLTGGGSAGTVTVAVATGGISTSLLADGAVTAPKIAAGQVVKSLNGLEDSVTIAAGSNISIGSAGNTITISAAGGGGGGGTITGVTAGTGLTGGGSTGTVNLAIASGGVGTSQLQDSSVTAAKISPSGASNGQTLVYNGSTVAWQSPPSGLTLPFAGSASSSQPALNIQNDGSGYAIRGYNSGSGGGLFTLTGSGQGVHAESTSGVGMYAASGSSNAVFGYVASGSSSAVKAVQSGTGIAVEGTAVGGNGVYGKSSTDEGVSGQSTSSAGVYGIGYYGVFGKWTNAVAGLAGRFDGPVTVNGQLTKSGGSFRIDHPLDPENKFLYHSFVESPDMKNMYDGVVTLDANGAAVVSLPDWFEALNKDFRYLLTAIGAAAPNLHIAAELQGNSFQIGGGKPHMKVSWQVTGTRQDAWANANRIPVEVDKPEQLRGHYIHPEVFGHPEERSLAFAENPERAKREAEQVRALAAERAAAPAATAAAR